MGRYYMFLVVLARNSAGRRQTRAVEDPTTARTWRSSRLAEDFEALRQVAIGNRAIILSRRVLKENPSPCVAKV